MPAEVTHSNDISLTGLCISVGGAAACWFMAILRQTRLAPVEIVKYQVMEEKDQYVKDLDLPGLHSYDTGKPTVGDDGFGSD